MRSRKDTGRAFDVFDTTCSDILPASRSFLMLDLLSLAGALTVAGGV